MTASKIVAAAASSAGGGAGLDVDEVFSTFLYEGSTGTAQTFVNGVDLTEGGLVWGKARNSDKSHWLHDTERGTEKVLRSNADSAEVATSNAGVTSFNNNGFTVGNSNYWNENQTGLDYVSWTFRKAKKFFTIVDNITMPSSGSVVVNHDLGSRPGMILLKCKDDSIPWYVYHQSNGHGKWLGLDSTANVQSYTYVFQYITDTSFSTRTNSPGDYIAYVFAHHDGSDSDYGSGDFGPDSDQDIIKCGSYSGNGSSTGPVVDLGFEPQWLMIKNASSSGPWVMLDNMRGWPVTDDVTYNDHMLWANTSDAEYTTVKRANITPTGFQIRQSNSQVNTNGNTYIYMAIRRGPLAVPEDATKVFAPNYYGTSGYVGYLGAPADMSMLGYLSGNSQNAVVYSRLTPNNKALVTSSTGAEITTNSSWDNMLGVTPVGSTLNTLISWTWKRAPGYFDVVCYTGNYTDGRTVTHNLGVAPEMIWVKLRDTYSAEWMVFHKDLATNHNLILNSTGGSSDYSGRVRTPTATTFTVSNDTSVNRQSPLTYIAYLFATVAGVSKVGSYTGSGATKTIDCGFSSGARFVLIKRADASNEWYIFDTVRGITTTSNDGVLRLNSNQAQYTEAGWVGYDMIQPDNSGFKLTSDSQLNANTGTYIFYAIA